MANRRNEEDNQRLYVHHLGHIKYCFHLKLVFNDINTIESNVIELQLQIFNIHWKYCCHIRRIFFFSNLFEKKFLYGLNVVIWVFLY